MINFRQMCGIVLGGLMGISARQFGSCWEEVTTLQRAKPVVE